MFSGSYVLKIYIVVAFCLAASAATAGDSGWYNVATSSDGVNVYSIKYNSGVRVRKNGGNEYTVVVGKIHNTKTDKIDVLKWSVSDSDCAQGYGELVILDIEGNYAAKTSFAKGANNVASGIADMICAVTRQAMKTE